MRADLLPAVLPVPTGPPRTSGVHLSGLIRSMAVDYGFLDKKWAEDLKLVEVDGDGQAWWEGLDEDSKLRMSIGMAWEQWYLPQVPGVVHQPGEMAVEGIFMTPDGEGLDVLMPEWLPAMSIQHLGIQRPRTLIAIHEVKTTARSINTVGDIGLPNPKNWLNLMQVKGYCKGLQVKHQLLSPQVFVVFLHILYLHGDYSRPITPKLHLWRLVFDQKEIDDAWALVSEYRNQHISLDQL